MKAIKNCNLATLKREHPNNKAVANFNYQSQGNLLTGIDNKTSRRLRSLHSLAESFYDDN